MSELTERERVSRLLVVEDDRSQLRTMVDIMKDEGFDVVGCSTGTEALEYVAREEVGVAVVDLRLPDLVGTELLERIHSLDRRVRVVINTGYGSFDSARDAVNLGAYAYVEKAGDPDELVRHVHRAFHSAMESYAEMMEAAVVARTKELVLANSALRDEIVAREHVEAERRSLEAELRQSQKMEAVGTLAAGIAHDFNNLMTAILGFAHTVEAAEKRGEGIDDSIQGIKEAVEQATQVTRSLLTFSRKSSTSRAHVDLYEIVNKSMEMLARMLPSNIKISIDMPSGRGLWIYADRVQIQQVILNLVINARDAMPQGGDLNICAKRRDEVDGDDSGEGTKDEVLLLVEDSGSGISEQIQDRLFEPFFTTKTKGQGTGLGLAIVHGIVADHDGSIEIRSEKNCGTCFTVRLPDTRPVASMAENKPSLGETKMPGGS